MASNFLEIGEALSNIALKLSKNQQIAKLLTCNDKDPLNHTDLQLNSEAESILNKNIILVPSLDLRSKKTSYLSIVTPEGSTSENEEFSDIYVCIDVVVPLELWLINDKCPRPILLMDEVKKTLHNYRITNVGTMQFDTYSLDIPTDEVGIYQMIFKVNILG